MAATNNKEQADCTAGAGKSARGGAIIFWRGQSYREKERLREDEDIGAIRRVARSVAHPHRTPRRTRLRWRNNNPSDGDDLLPPSSSHRQPACL